MAPPTQDNILTPQSLKRLETLYFQLVETQGFDTFGVSHTQFESAMSFYFGAVAAKNDDQCQWIILPSVFAPGHYDIAIEQGLLTVCLLRWCEDWYQEPDNKRRQKLYRDYRRWFVR